MVIELGLVAFVVRYFLRDSPQGRNAQRPGWPSVVRIERIQSNVGLRFYCPEASPWQHFHFCHANPSPHFFFALARSIAPLACWRGIACEPVSMSVPRHIPAETYVTLPASCAIF